MVGSRHRGWCRNSHCGAPILWAITPNGRKMPIDPDPSGRGNIQLIERDPPLSPIAVVVAVGEGDYLPHWESCHSPEAFRRRERKAARE